MPRDRHRSLENPAEGEWRLFGCWVFGCWESAKPRPLPRLTTESHRQRVPAQRQSGVELNGPPQRAIAGGNPASRPFGESAKPGHRRSAPCDRGVAACFTSASLRAPVRIKHHSLHQLWSTEYSVCSSITTNLPDLRQPDYGRTICTNSLFLDKHHVEPVNTEKSTSPDQTPRPLPMPRQRWSDIIT